MDFYTITTIIHNSQESFTESHLQTLTTSNKEVARKHAHNQYHKFISEPTIESRVVIFEIEVNGEVLFQQNNEKGFPIEIGTEKYLASWGLANKKSLTQW